MKQAGCCSSFILSWSPTMARLRTFIAVELLPAIRARCVALQEALGRSGADVKWVEPDNLHVTLLFLGEVDERDVPALCRAVATACAGLVPFGMSVDHVDCFGDRRRPRTIWAGLGAGKLDMVALHDALEPPLLELGCYRREDRPYTPHITLGRARGNRPSDRLAQELDRQAGWRGGECQVGEVVVLSSELRPEGPVYTVLSRAPLGRSAK
jgi:2'-5' RNA ligase